MAYVELATSNDGKTKQAMNAAREVIMLQNRQGHEFEYFFDEDGIKSALETQLGIRPDRPFTYALTISQLKMMKHSAEMAAREPDHALEVIPLVTDSIAITLDENGQYLGINRDELKADDALKERYASLIKQHGIISYAAFASFTFPGDDTVYTAPTFLDVKPSREITSADLPTNPNTIPSLAESYTAGFLRLTEDDPSSDFQIEKMPITQTSNWEAPQENRHEPARQYMGGTTFGLMNLIKKMDGMSAEERHQFDGRLEDGTVVPFRSINREAYAGIIPMLPLPQPKSA